MVCSTHQDPDRQRRQLRALRAQGVDGLIVAPIVDRASDWAAFEGCHFGVVSLERQVAGFAGGWVSLDNVRGARLAMAHLLALGHRRVALINGPTRVSWCAARREGAMLALEEAGLDPARSLVDVEVDDLTVQQGQGAVESILDHGDVTAIMCVNDMLALGALLAMQERGLRVPQDMALVGYDDADFAAALNPPLTTVHQPSYEMGVAAARLLLGDRVAGDHIDFEPRLVVRASSGRA